MTLNFILIAHGIARVQFTDDQSRGRTDPIGRGAASETVVGPDIKVDEAAVVDAVDNPFGSDRTVAAGNPARCWPAFNALPGASSIFRRWSGSALERRWQSRG